MTKSKEMENFLNVYSQTAFGRQRDGKLCVTCGSDKVKLTDFTDDISRSEFRISFMCQKCQDSSFGEE